MTPKTLSVHDKAVLLALAEFGGTESDTGFAPFATIHAEMSAMGYGDTDRRRIRLSCRKLRRMGMTEYQCGLWGCDGLPVGAGYGATRAGMARAEWIRAKR